MPPQRLWGFSRQTILIARDAAAALSNSIARAIDKNGSQISHGAAGHQTSRLFAQFGGGQVFQFKNRWIFMVSVITELGRKDSRQHFSGGERKGITAQLDQLASPFLCRRKSRTAFSRVPCASRQW